MLKFLSAMHFIRINFLPVLSNENVLHSLKNGRRYHNFWVTLLDPEKTKAPRMYSHWKQ